MKEDSRRIFLKNGMIAGVLGFITGPVYGFRPTPKEAEGPFYPLYAQKDKDFDLTRIEDSQNIALGRAIFIQGKVLDTENNPLEDSTIDLWQANAAGRYRHPHDTNRAPLDPNFQGWAILQSGKQGTFRFKTVFPGAYPASAGWTRPPHIHFKISKTGYLDLITQMYFPGHPLNESDRLLQRKSEQEQQMMISSKISDSPETYEYNIVLQKL